MWGWLGGFVALVAIAWLVARGFRGYRTAPGRRLAGREMALLEAAAEALFPAGGAIPQSGNDARVAAYVDRLVDAQGSRNRILMRALFVLMEHATLVFPAPGGISGFRRFTGLAPEQQMAALDAWSDSRIFSRRLAFTSLRAMLTLGYFAHPPVLRALALAPYAIEPRICEADILYPRIGASRNDLTLSRSDLTPPSEGLPLSQSGPLMPGYDEASD